MRKNKKTLRKERDYAFERLALAEHRLAEAEPRLAEAEARLADSERRSAFAEATMQTYLKGGFPHQSHETPCPRCGKAMFTPAVGDVNGILPAPRCPYCGYNEALAKGPLTSVSASYIQALELENEELRADVLFVANEELGGDSPLVGEEEDASAQDAG